MEELHTMETFFFCVVHALHILKELVVVSLSKTYLQSCHLFVVARHLSLANPLQLLLTQL